MIGFVRLTTAKKSKIILVAPDTVGTLEDVGEEECELHFKHGIRDSVKVIGHAMNVAQLLTDPPTIPEPKSEQEQPTEDEDS